MVLVDWFITQDLSSSLNKSVSSVEGFVNHLLREPHM